MERNAADLHVPVLLNACLDLLEPALVDGGLFIDCTLGMGGHTEAVLNRFDNIRAVGIDRDSHAIELASARLAPFGDRFTAVHTPYDHLSEVVAEHGRPQAILMDLGVSSLQLDDADRGFAYTHDGPLDMRMDHTSTLTAADYLANVSHGELTKVLSQYGEEKFASRVAARILDAGDPHALTTADLAEIVRDAIPQAGKRTGGHPAKRTFQALRIAVNDELRILERTLPQALDALTVGGRLVVESYHSLEDRMVKRAMKSAATSTTPIDLPVDPVKPDYRVVTHGAIQADDTELVHNSRSASVRLRACERVHEGMQS